MNWKIKMEAEVIKNCSGCPLYIASEGVCIWDGEEAVQVLYRNDTSEKLYTFPCDIRPCPLEVKE